MHLDELLRRNNVNAINFLALFGHIIVYETHDMHANHLKTFKAP
jgi:hypothetical protein